MNFLNYFLCQSTQSGHSGQVLVVVAVKLEKKNQIRTNMYRNMHANFWYHQNIQVEQCKRPKKPIRIDGYTTPRPLVKPWAFFVTKMNSIINGSTDPKVLLFLHVSTIQGQGRHEFKAVIKALNTLTVNKGMAF